MFTAVDTTPPAPSATLAVIDERWTAAPAIKAPAAPPAKLPMADPRVTQGVAAVLAEAPAADGAPNRREGIQRAAYGSDARAKFARDFSEAKVPPCLSPSTGGLGLFAIPVIAVQAMRGKCLMP